MIQVELHFNAEFWPPSAQFVIIKADFNMAPKKNGTAFRVRIQYK